MFERLDSISDRTAYLLVALGVGVSLLAAFLSPQDAMLGAWVQRGEESLAVEHVAADIDLANGSLFGRGVFLLDNPQELSGGTPDDPPQPVIVLSFRGANHAGRVLVVIISQ